MIPDEIGYFSEEDTLLLMHCDVHFSQNFELMADYYSTDGLGADPDISLRRIIDFAKLSREQAIYLFTHLITPDKLPWINKAKDTYEKLREVYESKDTNLGACLVSDLILSEEEDTSEEEQAIFKYGASLVPALEAILLSDLYHNPLSPGYGNAPMRALRSLKLFKDNPVIMTVFQSLGIGEDPFYDFQAASYFLSFEKEAKDFLFLQLQSEKVSDDHRKALFCLAEFELSEEDLLKVLHIWESVMLNARSLVLAPYFSSLISGHITPLIYEKLKKMKASNPTHNHLEEINYLLK